MPKTDKDMLGKHQQGPETGQRLFRPKIRRLSRVPANGKRGVLRRRAEQDGKRAHRLGHLGGRWMRILHAVAYRAGAGRRRNPGTGYRSRRRWHRDGRRSSHRVRALCHEGARGAWRRITRRPLVPLRPHTGSKPTKLCSPSYIEESIGQFCGSYR